MHKKILYIASGFIIISVGIYLNFANKRVYSFFHLTTNPNTSLNYTVGNAHATQTIRYSSLGDSLTAGVGAEKIEQSYPYLLSEKIVEKNTQIKLFNLGQPGATSADVLNQQIVPLTSFDPDLITLCIGTNDIHTRVPLSVFKNNYNKILDELTKYEKAKIILTNLPYLGTDDLILPPMRWYFNSRIQKYNSIITEIATERKLTLVDLYDKTREPFQNNQDKMYSIDKYHPSADGYALWADLIYASYR